MADILLIESDNLLGTTLAGALKKAGHQVRVHRSGQSALDEVEKRPPELIILEIQLGLHNGVEFLYELRSYDDWSLIPVIIHTGNRNVLSKKFSSQLQLLNVSKVLYKPQTKVVQLIGAAENALAAA